MKLLLSATLISTASAIGSLGGYHNFLGDCAKLGGSAAGSFAGEYRPSHETHNGQSIYVNQNDATKVWQYRPGEGWNVCTRSGTSGPSDCQGSHQRFANGDIFYVGSIYTWGSNKDLFNSFCDYGTNVAHNRPATASSVYGPSWVPSKLVDGSQATTFHGGVTDPNNWWQVELDHPMALEVVRLLNRDDGGCNSRLFHGRNCNNAANLQSFTGADQGAEVRLSNTPCNSQGCSGGHVCGKWQTEIHTNWYEMDCGTAEGKYLSISLPGNNRMMNFHLLEAFQRPCPFGKESNGSCKSPVVKSFAGDYNVFYQGTQRDTGLTVGCDGSAAQGSIFSDSLHFDPTDVYNKCYLFNPEATMYIDNAHGAGKYECLHQDGTTIKGEHYLESGAFWGSVEYTLAAANPCTAAPTTASPTPAPTTAAQLFHQQMSQSLSVSDYASGIDGDTVWKCHNNPAEGCYVSEAGSRSRWSYESTKPSGIPFGPNPTLTATDGTVFNFDPVSTTVITGDGFEYYHPNECQC